MASLNFLGSSYSGADIKLIVHSSASEIVTEDRDKRIREAWASYDTLTAEQQSGPEGQILTELAAQLAEIEVPEAKLPLATIQTLSVQVFRETIAVRALGYVSPKGFCRGGRTIGGSAIFTIFDEHALASLLHHPPTGLVHETELEAKGKMRTYIDQLPPMTITAVFANEYGSLSQLNIYGVQFVTDGQVMSIEDIFSEATCQFVAREYDVMLKKGDVDLETGSATLGQSSPTSASSLLTDPAYQDFNTRLGVSGNPFK